MTGRVILDKGKLTAVISYKEDGKPKQAWRRLNIDTNSSKRLIDKRLREVVNEFEHEFKTKVCKSIQEQMNAEKRTFGVWVWDWLGIWKPRIGVATYSTYRRRVKIIADYFEKLGILLVDLTPMDIQSYYKFLLDSGKTTMEAEHHHVNIHKALQVAFKMGLIQSNPASRVERPKSPKYNAKFYTIEQIRALFEAIKGSKFELLIIITLVYGLRRSEVLGIKWSAIDFDKDTLAITHSVIQTEYNGKLEVIRKDKMKNQSSRRTLPLLPFVKELLLAEKAWQERNKALYKAGYNMKFADYVFVDDLGNLARPQTVSDNFQRLLVRNGLPRIRFHELRHSCASLLLACGVSMKEIQDWLGHSTFTTTADIYSHLDFQSKVGTGDIMSRLFGGKPVDIKSQSDTDVRKGLERIFYSAAEVREANINDERNSEWDCIEGGTDDAEVVYSVDDGEDDTVPFDPPYTDTSVYDEFKRVQAEMARLGFSSMGEYLEYIASMAQRMGKVGGVV